MTPAGAALVIIVDNGSVMRRAAALVYRTQTGIGWLEPGYWDVFPPSSPQWHEREGTVTDTTNGLFVRTATGTILVIDYEQAKADQDSDLSDVRESFDWLDGRLKELGTTLAEQRLVIAAMLVTVTG